MSQHGENAMVDDAAFVGSIQGLQERIMEEMHTIGGPSGLLRACSMSPHPRYSPYGVCTFPAETGASHVMRTRP